MERMSLVREYELYEGRSPVKSNLFTRRLHHVVGQREMVEGRGRAGFDMSSKHPPCLVFEWMESMFYGTCAQSHTVENPSFPR